MMLRRHWCRLSRSGFEIMLRRGGLSTGRFYTAIQNTIIKCQYWFLLACAILWTVPGTDSSCQYCELPQACRTNTSVCSRGSVCNHNGMCECIATSGGLLYRRHVNGRSCVLIQLTNDIVVRAESAYSCTSDGDCLAHGPTFSLCVTDHAGNNVCVCQEHACLGLTASPGPEQNATHSSDARLTTSPEHNATNSSDAKTMARAGALQVGSYDVKGTDLDALISLSFFGPLLTLIAIVVICYFFEKRRLVRSLVTEARMKEDVQRALEDEAIEYPFNTATGGAVDPETNKVEKASGATTIIVTALHSNVSEGAKAAKPSKGAEQSEYSEYSEYSMSETSGESSFSASSISTNEDSSSLDIPKP